MPVGLSPPYLPEIPGDPAGMRRLAATARGHAGALGGLAAGIESDVSAMTFEGPAAEEFRPRMRAVAKAYHDAQNDLHEAARQLESAAADVEQQQRERERRLAQMWDEYHALQRQLATGAAP